MTARTITLRAAVLGALILASLAALGAAGLIRVMEPARAEFVTALTPATSGPHITYSDQGAWRVPSQVAPGQYNVWAGDRECVWQRLSAFSDTESSVLEEGRVAPRTSRRVLVYKTDRAFRTIGPCEWELAS